MRLASTLARASRSAARTAPAAPLAAFAPLRLATYTPLASTSTACSSLPTLRPFSSTAPALKKGGKDKKDKGGKKEKGGKKAAEEEEEGLSPEEVDALVEKTKSRITKAVDWAKGVVYEGVERGRGRVTPSLLDSVKVQTPDGSAPLKSVASITVRNHALHVEVWDTSLSKAVDSAVNKANIPGLSPQRDGNALRIPVSRPTGDMRTQILRSLADTGEQAKNQIRQARAEGLKSLGGRGEEGTEDVQQATDDATAEIDKLLATAKKEFEKA